ncbi:MAG: hypothetical protein EOO15_11850 [Chitinophagaceae bacterium]|nr:MAG: hypothetical protein EOO15_11850 [Chitinophagaceae bacterium]
MKYELNKLNSTEFEHLSQSIAKKILGNGTISFTDGPDGGREATFTGKAPFPSLNESWDGLWYIQAKFKNSLTPNAAKDLAWLEGQITSEFRKLKTRKSKVQIPDNYIIFTNIQLTPTANSGTRDKATKLERDWERKHKIKHVRIISEGDIRDYLDNFRDIATSYAPFILPGDILANLLEISNARNARNKKISGMLTSFIESEFIEELQSKLDHAGKLTNDKIHLEKVFIDLYATETGNYQQNELGFVHAMIQKGNHLLRITDIQNRFVLIAGPGFGKSTLTQFLAQIHRGYFLKDTTAFDDKLNLVQDFIKEFEATIKIKPKWPRLAFNIKLKDYAGWINDRIVTNPQSNISILTYITYTFNKKCAGGNLTIDELEDLIVKLPCLFIYDGLDEVPSTSNRSEVLYEIKAFNDTFLKRINSDYLLIGTSRPQGYNNDFAPSKFTHLQIAELNAADCRNYLRKLLDLIIEDINEREQKLRILERTILDPEHSRLMKSTLQASIMAILVRSGGELPRNKFDLFTDYYEIIYRRERQRNILKILNDAPDYIRDVHNYLGLTLQSKSENTDNPSSMVSVDDFRLLTQEYLSNLGLEKEEVNEKVELITRAAMDRLVFITETQDQKIGFNIRSLQEFFAANGYIHNVKDSEIIDRLRIISKSSYWNNTFLFAIGYVAKNKKYLVSLLESLCHELNGSGDDRNARSLNAIAKTGSWLALDIVNEGIFRGNPNHENRFNKIIIELLLITFQKKHHDISLLPTKILETWICPALIEILEKSPKCSTAWRIAIILSNKGIFEIDKVSDWLPKDSNTLYDIFADFSFPRNNIGILSNIFGDAAPLITKHQVWNLFYSYHRSFYYRNRNTAITFIEEKKRFELSFLYCISAYSEKGDLAELLEILQLDNKLPDSNTRALFEGTRDTLTISLSSFLEYTITKTKVRPNFIWDEVIKYANEHKIVLVQLVCSFFIEPTIKNLANLEAHLLHLESEYKEIVVKQLQSSCSFFNYYYNHGVIDPSSLLNKIDILTFEEVTSSFETMLTSLQYRNRQTCTIDNTLADMTALLERYKQEIPQENKEHSLAQIIDLAQWLNVTFEQEEYSTLISRISKDPYFYQALVEFSALEKEKNGAQTLLLIMQSLELNEIEKAFNEFPALQILYKDRHKTQNRLEEYGYNAINCLKKAGDLIRKQLAFNEEPFIDLLAKVTILTIDFINKPIDNVIPFEDLKKIEMAKSNEFPLSLLLLLGDCHDLEIEKKSDSIISAIMNDYSEAILESTLTILKHVKNQNLKETILVKLDRNLANYFDPMRSTFEMFVREHITTTATNFPKGYLKNFQ